MLSIMTKLRIKLSPFCLSAILLVPPALADTTQDTITTFDISGTALYLPEIYDLPEPFSGTFQMDESTGAILPNNLDISFSFFGNFTQLSAVSYPNDPFLIAYPTDGSQLYVVLDYHYAYNTPVLSSGPDAGVFELINYGLQGDHNVQFYSIQSVTATPVATSTPEPSFLWPLAGALVFGIGRGMFGKLRAVQPPKLQ